VVLVEIVAVAAMSVAVAAAVAVATALSAMKQPVFKFQNYVEFNY
jgi:hypothetical protein